ncbi:MAG: class I SAM-dependent methyltransferase [Solirubrobacterales bacterium]
MSVDWDAKTYDRVADPQEEWGRQVLDRLSIRGDETVLDAGCGSGRVTRLLLERLPEGRVIGVDASPSMIEKARESPELHGEFVDAVLGSMARPLALRYVRLNISARRPG